MNPEDNEAANPYPNISSRPPFLPPATRKQALDALLSPDSLSFALIHPVQPWHEPGLAESLVQGMPQQQTPESGLAGALASHGITSLPDADPRLVNVTRDPAKPAFETARGTVIQMNHTAPRTVLPWGEGLDHLIAFADGTGAQKVTINGGSEAVGHGKSPADAHPNNRGIDVAPDLAVSEAALKRAALAAGYTHGIRELRPGSVHYHFQVGPDNIGADRDLFDLSNDGPIGTKDYTKGATASPPRGP